MKKNKFLSRVLACTLVLSVILSQMIFSSSAISASAADAPVWDGTTAESFAGGDGSAASPFLIETAEQLHKMVVDYSTYDASYGKYFKIKNDIYLNDVKNGTFIENVWGKKNWLEGYGDTIAASSKTNSFYGTLDGEGNTIYGLYISGVQNAGLFPAIGSYTVIKNLNFNNLLITGGSGNGGAIAGRAYYYTWQSAAQITNCSLVNATIGQWNNMENVGGFVGTANDCSVTVNNCYAYDISLSDWQTPGAFIGNTWGSSGSRKINNSYCIGYFPTRSTASDAVCTNVYTDTAVPEGNTTANVTVLTAEQMKGVAAKENMTGLDFNWVWETVENGYPVLRDEIITVWDGSKDYNLEGTGSEANPYLIKTAEQLAAIVTGSNGGAFTGKYFKLANDIRINDTFSANWKESARNWVWADFRFVGTFDGNGHTIDGLYYKGSQRVMGLFSYVGADNNGVYKTTIKNFNMTNAYIESTAADGAGFVSGQASRVAYFDTIYIDDTCEINSTVKGAGGILGQSGYNVFMSNIGMNGKVVGGSNFGAFAGTLSSGARLDIKSSYTSADLYAQGVTDRNLATASANVYVTKKQETVDAVATLLTTEQMKGENAKTNMPALDYVCVWQTVENDYPILRKNLIYGWDGTAAESFAGGTGTEADPFLIENGGQLYKMIADYSNTPVSAIPESHTYFRITKDINLGGEQWYVTGKTSYPNNSNYTTGFSGIVDGGNHTIYSLYSNKSSATVGLIPVATQGAEIHNLHLESGNLPKAAWNTYAVGGFIGLAVGTKGSAPIVIEECSVKDYTIASRDASAAFVGYTHSQSVTIKDCFATGNNISNTGTAAGDNSGAFIGTADGNDENNKITVETSYCADEAALIGFKLNTARITTFKDVYTANEAYDNSVAGLTKLTNAQMQGSAAAENLDGFNFNQIWQNGAEGEYPAYKSDEYKAMYWNGTAAESFAAGEGTAQKPYEISDASELYLLANSDTDATTGKYYKLTKDIVISNVYEGWENHSPFAWASKNVHLEGFAYKDSFAGTLDGAGHTVSGLYFEDEITDNGTYAYGLIPYVTADAVIKNLNVENVSANVSGNAYVGGVAGAAHVATEDIANKFKMIQFVGVNVADCDITAANAGDILGGATRGVKFELCNAENIIGSYTENVSIRNCNSEDFAYNDDVIIYNSLNADSTALVNIRKYLLNAISNYITDINGDSVFDIRDLVSAKKSLVTSEAEERLVWSQEFNDDSLDYTVWNENTTMSKGSTLEYADNTSFNGESMTLSCNDTGKVDENGDKIYSVNHGLDTIDSMSFKYGRLEMRAKLPFAAGAFPSLWLTSRSAIGYESKCEYSTEIDIFEIFANAGSSSKVITCIHKWYNDENGVKTGEECSCGTGVLAGNTYKVEESDRSYVIDENAQNDFHTFGFEWDENSMKFSVDGNVYYTVDRSVVEQLHFDLSGKDTDIAGIFEQFVCIRLNNHMYTPGEGSAYTYTGNASDIDASELNYEIDYIRLYQKNDGKSAINFR